MTMFSKLFKKTITVPEDNEVKTIETIQLWMVEWYSRYDSYSGSTTKEIEAFPDEDVANDFADSLRKAFTLLRHTSGNKVRVYKN